MSESKAHKTTATRIADSLGVEYNNGKGVDVKAPDCTVEVETPETVSDGVGQLRGHRGDVYIAGTNQKAVDAALERTENTTIGVMDKDGNIVKFSTRRG